MVNNMFQLDTLVRDRKTKIMLGWKPYYQNKDIYDIYRTIEMCNNENKIPQYDGSFHSLYEVMSYRILIDDRVFAFVDATQRDLDYMREKYNTNEKCKIRYTYSDYDLGYEKVKTKKKGGKR